MPSGYIVIPVGLIVVVLYLILRGLGLANNNSILGMPRSISVIVLAALALLTVLFIMRLFQ